MDTYQRLAGNWDGSLAATAAATDLCGDVHPADVDGFDYALGQRHGDS